MASPFLDDEAEEEKDSLFSSEEEEGQFSNFEFFSLISYT